MSLARIGSRREWKSSPRPRLLALAALAAALVLAELITAVDGTATPDPATLADVLAGLQPGQSVAVAVARPDGARQTVPVTLGQFPG